MERPSPELVDCPHCGAKNFAIDDLCFACKRSLTLVIGPRPRVRQLSLGSVMMIVAVVALCLAPIRVMPGLSIFLALILIPASTRTILHVEGRKAEGRPMIVEEKINAFVGSAAITLLISLAASTAFLATCLPIGLMGFRLNDPSPFPPGIVVAWVAGTVSGLLALSYVAKRLWPRKD